MPFEPFRKARRWVRRLTRGAIREDAQKRVRPVIRRGQTQERNPVKHLPAHAAGRRAVGTLRNRVASSKAKRQRSNAKRRFGGRV